jgi:hypothetical protein
MDDEEIVLAINTDVTRELSAWVTIDDGLNGVGDVFSCIYPSAPLLAEAVVESRNGKAMLIRVPPAGFVVYKRLD